MADVGRPTIMTPETISLLEGAFLNGASDKEAIFQANIGSTTFYNYCAENPEFVIRKEMLKDQVKYRARKNIAEAINDGDKPLSQWYLERKVKDEFSLRTEQTGKDGVQLIPESKTDINIEEIAKRVGEELRNKKSTDVHQGTTI